MAKRGIDRESVLHVEKAFFKIMLSIGNWIQLEIVIKGTYKTNFFFCSYFVCKFCGNKQNHSIVCYMAVEVKQRRRSQALGRYRWDYPEHNAYLKHLLKLCFIADTSVRADSQAILWEGNLVTEASCFLPPRDTFADSISQGSRVWAQHVSVAGPGAEVRTGVSERKKSTGSPSCLLEPSLWVIH